MSDQLDVWKPDCYAIGFTDERILVGNKNSKKLFHVHKERLTDVSQKFSELFYGEKAEKECIIETDDDPEIFEILLNHFYENYPKIESLEIIKKLYEMGIKYEVIEIFEIVKYHLYGFKLSENEFWDLVESEDRQNALFADKIWDYAKEHAESLLKCEKIFNAPSDFIEGLLQIDDLNADEIDLLTAVTEWGYRHLKQVDSVNLIRFYQHIRFPTLRSDEFLHFTDCYPKAIDSESALRIFLFLHSTLYKDLPEWCSTNHVLRKNVFLMQQRRLDSTKDCDLEIIEVE